MNAIKKHWKTVLQSAVWLLGLMGTLLVKPDLYEDTGDLAKMVRFIVVGILALFWVPMLLFKRRKHMWRWWTAASVFFVGAIGCFGVAFYQLDMHTVFYDGDRTVVGAKEELLPEVIKGYDDAGQPLPSIELLVDEAAGHTEGLFEADLLKGYRYAIYLSYLLTALLTALLILSSGQAVVCLKG